jgi:predicted MFS family arabinose efflux permease
LPIILDALFNHSNISFGWSQRIIGFIFLGLSITAIFVIHPNVAPRKGKYLILSAFKKPAYTLQVIGFFFMLLGLFEPLFYIPTYAQLHGVSVGLSNHMIAILNAGSFIGRLVAGGLGIKIGQFNVISFCSVACGILILCWIQITSTPGLIAFSVLYGFFSGGFIGTMISTIPLLADHPSEIGTYIGMMSGVISFAALTGTPIDGAFVDKYGGFTQATIFSGIMALIGAGFIISARIAHGGFKLLV